MMGLAGCPGKGVPPEEKGGREQRQQQAGCRDAVGHPWAAGFFPEPFIQPFPGLLPVVETLFREGIRLAQAVPPGGKFICSFV